MRRIERKTALRDGLIDVEVETAGGLQTMPALTLDVLPGFLFLVDENRAKEETRPDTILFQRECVQALSDYFAHKHHHLPALTATQSLAPADPRLAGQVAQIAEQIDTLTGAVNLMREHLETLLALPEQVADISERLDETRALVEVLAARQQTAEGQIARIGERTQRLTPAHARAIQEQVNHMARETKRLPQPLTYAIIYGRLKYRFRASTYKEISDEQYSDVMAFLQEMLRRAQAGEAPEQGSLF